MSETTKKTIRIGLITLTVLALFVAGYLIISAYKTEQSKKQEEEARLLKNILVMNTNKSEYLLGEKVGFVLTAINFDGKILCSSNIKIEIVDPLGKTTTLTTEGKSISLSSTCNENANFTNDPDYRAFYEPQSEGIYKVRALNTYNNSETKTEFGVKKDVEYKIERVGTIRTLPNATGRHFMRINLASKNDLKGELVESIPKEFDIVWQGPSVVSENENRKTITWDVDIKANESKEFVYEYKTTAINPKVFTLGKIKIVKDNDVVFEDNNFWNELNSPMLSP